MAKKQYICFVKCGGQPGIQCSHLEEANDNNKSIPIQFFVSKAAMPGEFLEGLTGQLTEGFLVDARRLGWQRM
jgi:hypothetical protein